MKQRLYSIDAIRTIAMVLVIIVHTKGYFFSTDNSPLIFFLLKVLGTVGVPLFVILTGYLMIHRNYETDDYLKKYISNNLIPLFSAYEIWNIMWNLFRYTHFIDEPKRWIDVLFAALFMGDTQSALWYLPMIIALYLGIPIVSIICHRVTQFNYQKILFTFLLLSGTIIPSISDLSILVGKTLNVHPVFEMNVFGASVWGESVWMIYILSGHAIYKGKLKNIKNSVIVILGILFPFGIMYSLELVGKSVQKYNFILVILLSVSLFEILTRIEFFCKRSITLRLLKF